MNTINSSIHIRVYKNTEGMQKLEEEFKKHLSMTRSSKYGEHVFFWDLAFIAAETKMVFNPLDFEVLGLIDIKKSYLGTLSIGEYIKKLNNEFKTLFEFKVNSSKEYITP